MPEITEERLEELLAAEEKLSALEAYGVDNWEWYGDAMESLSEFDIEETEDEEIEGLR